MKTCTNENLCKDVYRALCLTAKNYKVTQMRILQLIGKWINELVHADNGILFGNKQEHIADTWSSTNEFEMTHLK